MNTMTIHTDVIFTFIGSELVEEVSNKTFNAETFTVKNFSIKQLEGKWLHVTGETTIDLDAREANPTGFVTDWNTLAQDAYGADINDPEVRMITKRYSVTTDLPYNADERPELIAAICKDMDGIPAVDYLKYTAVSNYKGVFKLQLAGWPSSTMSSTETLEAVTADWTEIEYDSAWENGTGYFDHLTSVIIEGEGNLFKAHDSQGRLIAIMRSEMGNFVLFQRYSGTQRPYVVGHFPGQFRGFYSYFTNAGNTLDNSTIVKLCGGDSEVKLQQFQSIASAVNNMSL